jgi:hypothetical protein
MFPRRNIARPRVAPRTRRIERDIAVMRSGPADAEILYQHRADKSFDVARIDCGAD